MRPSVVLFILFFIGTEKASLRAEDKHTSNHAIADLDVHPELQLTLFASEPMLANPTAIDVDAQGRVWVCEVINYRRFANGDQPERKEGDRILVLEDSDGDGTADRSTTFYQGRDIDSAHGVCVLGKRVLVSARDTILSFTDEDGDLHADSKEILFSGISGIEHDHGIHTVNSGPDGKLYFNFGNAGQQIKDKNGKPILDKAGNEVCDQGHPYRQGMVFRCQADGTQLETLGWNFRNNWEVAVDSFGGLWQSDNDDDGHRAVRINFLVEFGNYGYQDELTGASWSTPRTGWEVEVPFRHWHLQDPGVIPNMLQTGAGSPTGLCVYEGDLLPEAFRGQLLHCDAGPNVVRCYSTKKVGAGYTADIINIVQGTRDPWFRPTDVCVAPDGSLFVSDWYDPGVGGHRMQDTEHGRIFRIAPPNTPYRVPELKLENASLATSALQSPNAVTRTLAAAALRQMGDAAEADLARLWADGKPMHRARALWLLTDILSDRAKRLSYLKQGLRDPNPDMRCCAIRVARQRLHEFRPDEIHDAIDLHDPAPEVRREILIALRELHDPHAASLWAELAAQYDGHDRWYLEVLGIAADSRWDGCLSAWLQRIGQDWNTAAGRDILWRSRGEQTSDFLLKIISDPQTPTDQLPRYFRSLDFQPEAQKLRTVRKLLITPSQGDASRRAFIAREAIARLDDATAAELQSHPEFQQALTRALDSSQGTSQFIQLVHRFNQSNRFPEVLRLVQSRPESQLAAEGITLLLAHDQMDLLRNPLEGDDLDVATQTLKALGTCGDPRSAPLLDQVIRDPKRHVSVIREAIRAQGGSQAGTALLCALAEENSYDPALRESLAASLHAAPWPEIKAQALALFPPPVGKDDHPLPTLAELMELKGDRARGETVFKTGGTCLTCHRVRGEGNEVGPDLTEIGSKLSRQAMFESIVYPSAGISHNYESSLIVTVDGNVLSGIVTSETADAIQLKDAKGILHTIRPQDIEERKRQEISLMPAELARLVTLQELVDVVDYLETLKDEAKGSRP